MPLDERRIRQVFRLGLGLKGLHALIEIAGGLAFLLIPAPVIAAWIDRPLRAELAWHPRDGVAAWLHHAAQTLTGGTASFYAFYLLSHGVVQALLVIGLLRGRLIAYPLTLVVLGLFIAYQVHRYGATHSVGLLVLTLFDLVVMVLVWHEWRLLRRHRPVA